MKRYGVFYEALRVTGWTESRFTNHWNGFSYDGAIAIKDNLETDGEDGRPVRNIRIKEI